VVRIKFIIGVISAVGVLVAAILGMIAMDPSPVSALP